MIYSILVAVQVVVALGLIGLILVQHGKGADAGAAFGSGASGTVFGAKGTANFLSHATAVLATIFFALSLTLAYLVHSASGAGGASVTDQVSKGQLAPQPPAAVVHHNGHGGSGNGTGQASAGGQTGGAAAGSSPSNNNSNNRSSSTKGGGSSNTHGGGITTKIPQ
jgi:preprotein translocase subunit SecG